VKPDGIKYKVQKYIIWVEFHFFLVIHRVILKPAYLSENAVWRNEYVELNKI
jgi:hypothetical protein